MSPSRRVRRLIVLVIFDGVNMLDFSGTSQVFTTCCELVMAAGSNGATQDPYEIVLASSKGGLIRTSSGIRVETVSLRSLRPRQARGRLPDQRQSRHPQLRQPYRSSDKTLRRPLPECRNLHRTP